MSEHEAKPRAVLVVMIDIDPAYEADFNRWYNEEHFPERMSCPGFLSGRRYVVSGDGPKYLAVYELENEDVLTSEAYRAIMPPSEWEQRVTAHFTSRLRAVYTDITPELPGGTDEG